MVLASPILATIWYWGMMKIWLGRDICTSTMPNSNPLPLNSSLAKAYPAMELKSTAQITRNRIISPVFTYRLRKGRLLMASTKLSTMIFSGKIVGGTYILSGTVLELVRSIHTKGKIIIRAPRMRNT